MVAYRDCLSLAAVMTLAMAAPAFSAAATPAPPSTWVQTNGVSLHYELVGPRANGGKSTIVLLHEIGLSMQAWDEVMPALTANHRVLRYDLRGFGLSEKIQFTIPHPPAPAAEVQRCCVLLPSN